MSDVFKSVVFKPGFKADKARFLMQSFRDINDLLIS